MTFAPPPDVAREPTLSTEDYFPDLGTLVSMSFSNKVRAAMRLINPPKPPIDERLNRQSEATQVLTGAHSRTQRRGATAKWRPASLWATTLTPYGAEIDQSEDASSDSDDFTVSGDKAPPTRPALGSTIAGTQTQRLVTLTFDSSKASHRAKLASDRQKAGIHGGMQGGLMPGAPMRGGPHSLSGNDQPVQQHQQQGQPYMPNGAAGSMQAPMSGAAAAASEARATFVAPPGAGSGHGRQGSAGSGVGGSVGGNGAFVSHPGMGSGHGRNRPGSGGGAGSVGGANLPLDEHMLRHGSRLAPLSAPGSNNFDEDEVSMGTFAPPVQQAPGQGAAKGGPAPPPPPHYARNAGGTPGTAQQASGGPIDESSGSAVQVSTEPRRAPMLAAESTFPLAAQQGGPHVQPLWQQQRQAAPSQYGMPLQQNKPGTRQAANMARPEGTINARSTRTGPDPAALSVAPPGPYHMQAQQPPQPPVQSLGHQPRQGAGSAWPADLDARAYVHVLPGGGDARPQRSGGAQSASHRRGGSVGSGGSGGQGGDRAATRLSTGAAQRSQHDQNLTDV